MRHEGEMGLDAHRAHRRRRMRRHGRKAYIRSVYTLPSLATLGNAVCGFGAMYVAAMIPSAAGADPWAQELTSHRFVTACYLILLAMVFDALDGRLARFARHTTDFGGQLDSLADVVSFGAAPAFIALQAFKSSGWEIPFFLSRLIWAIGALYFACAAIRLARFNVSNEHGEQHHFSFLGLPSPGAAGAVIGLVLMQQDLLLQYGDSMTRQKPIETLRVLSNMLMAALPIVLLGTGLLMVANIRYPHLVNRYLRGRRSIGRLLTMLVILLFLVVAHRYTIGVMTLVYAAWGLVAWTYVHFRPRPPQAENVPSTSPSPVTPAAQSTTPPPT